MSFITNDVVKHGKTKYITGSFESKKNNSVYSYSSSYELAFLYQLEEDKDVIQYIYEPFNVFYINSENNKKVYKPDFMILYRDGSVKISEVKPRVMLKDYDVQAKAKACKQYISEKYKDINISYSFITESELFSSEKEYIDFIKSIKAGN